MLYEFTLNTKREEMTDITNTVRDALRESGVKEGLCVVYCPHTTAGITINENADPDVVHDILLALGDVYPNRADFRHDEGNSSAHLKTSAVGASETVIVRDGKLLLGTWQSLFFCEFDGPRTRKFFVKLLG